MAPPYPTLTALRALRVVDLKQRLADLGLPQSGLKADLVARLDAHFNGLRQREVDDDEDDEAVSPPAATAQVGSWGHPTLGFQAQEAQQQAAVAAAAMAMRSPTSEYAQPAQFGMGFGSPQHQQYGGMEAYGMSSPPMQAFAQVDPMMQQQQQFLAEQQRQQEELRLQQEMLLQRQREQQEALLLQQQQQQQQQHEEEERRRQALLRQRAEQEERERLVLIREQQQRQQEEERLRLEEDERRRQQQALLLEQQRQMEMQRRLQEEEEERRRQLQEERQRQEILRQQEEQRRLVELQRQKEFAAEEERLRLLHQQEEQKRLAEVQMQKEMAAEEERQRLELLQQQQEQQHHQQEQRRMAELQRQKEDEERQRQELLQHQEEQKRLKEEDERQKQVLLQQQQAEQERQRLQQQQQAEQERQRLQQQQAEQERQRLQQQQVEQERQLQQQQQEQERQQRQVQIRLEASKATSVVSAPVRLMDTGDLEDDPTPAGPISAQSSKSAAVGIPKAMQEEASRGFEAVPDSFGFDDADDDDETESSSKAGDKRRNKKKKKKRRNRPEEWARQAAEAERRKREEEELKDRAKDDVEVVYVQEKLDLDPADPMYRTFAKIFDAFKITEDEDDKTGGRSEAEAEHVPPSEELKKVPKLLEEDDLIEERDSDSDDDKPKLSKRKLKLLNRLSVAELKQLVPRPDVVEMHDVTARDPRLLVHLKSVRNSVPVPRHWCFKRKYLQGKRGIEKPPFNLPEFIKKTGIMEMRAALQEKEDAKNLKSKMREKVRPKLGKIDIDYQKLHDAFFKWQTKPRMSGHGDLYYEGKEFEIRLKEKKPGDLTDDLRTALGMPVGPNAFKVPPPWLIAMQRYGPPPSYPNLRIPGLNAGIPEGCSFGYHAGGWGKPPVDESGKPLYGDVFGSSDSNFGQNVPQEEIDTTLWGEMESESEEEASEEEEDEAEDGDEDDSAEARQAAGMQTPVLDGAGLATPSGMSSVGASVLGQETPELLELRKKRIEAEMEGGETPNLFTVLPEKRHERVGGAMMGSTHTYDLASKRAGTGGGGGTVMDGGIELALNPDEVDLVDTDAMRARAEAAMRERREALGVEDFSDMVAEHAAKQSSKRKRPAASGRGEDSKSAKKYKEFKF